MTQLNLRWLAEPGTSTKAPRLQMRDWQSQHWQDVPVAVGEEFPVQDPPPVLSVAPELPPAAFLAQIQLSAGLARRGLETLRLDYRSIGVVPADRMLAEALAHIDNLLQAAQRLSAANQP